MTLNELTVNQTNEYFRLYERQQNEMKQLRLRQLGEITKSKEDPELLKKLRSEWEAAERKNVEERQKTFEKHEMEYKTFCEEKEKTKAALEAARESLEYADELDRKSRQPNKDGEGQKNVEKEKQEKEKSLTDKIQEQLERIKRMHQKDKAQEKSINKGKEL